ncbi:vitellogenin 3, phosvitinless [Megalops cyprinoides]|uniref:vitellogenin 3, phosvitinless n=1 Tax=Megalops cyprinoides TaxID=118141 RepID=UPI001863F76E|nr:vitellogenin 3, phosvitinless [Megalops cyprinoides]
MIVHYLWVSVLDIMRGILLFLCAALAACQNISYEPGLNPKKTYEYKYDGVITIGRDMPDLAESGVRMKGSVKIIGVSAKTFLLQVSNMAFEEFNGFPGKSAFAPSPKLTERIAAQLAKPIMFEYANGRVGDIHAGAEVSNTVVNIARGILGFLQVTIKSTQNVYELKEVGIHGICQSHYFIEENTSSKELFITQVVDISNCQEKAEIYTGMALAIKNKNCKERGENLKTAVKYTYTVRPTDDGALVTKAHSDELQFFSPFNVKGGSSKVKAIKNLVLISVTDTEENQVIGPLQNRGNLIYKFGNELNQIPLVLKNVADPMTKISELLQRIAEANMNEVDATTSTDIFDLYQLLRVTTLENLEALWTQFSGNAEYRRWLLDTVTEVADARVIKFLKNRFQKADITVNEAAQTLLVALNHVTADAESLELSKEFLRMQFTKSSEFLWSIVAMSYGSVVYRYCANTEPCPATAVQPLVDFAIDSLNKGSEEEMVLALKSLGNAGHPSSIKTIMKFLPGISPTDAVLPTRVLNAAVQSLRLMAIKEPHMVQDIAFRVFVQRHLPSEVRMLAYMVLFDTKPSFALVSTVTAFLLEETNLQLASFSYSLLQGLARSQTPDNHYLSIACDVAVKILSRKLGRLTFRYSRAVVWGWFNDDFLFGTAGEIYILDNAARSFPTAITFRGHAFLIGRILQLQEVGLRAEGIRELFSQIPPINGKANINNIGAILKMLSEWQSLPKDKPLLSAFVRVFGQEVFYIDINRDMIQRGIQALSPFAGKESPLWKVIEDLQKGIQWHWTKPYLVFETRYIQATSLGLPVEISKYYSSITGITANAKGTISPPPTDNLGQLLNSDISIETDGDACVVKDHFLFHGINTDIVQSGAEFKSQTILNMPWKFAMKLNVKAKKFHIDISPCQKPTELLSVNFNVYAVSRNIEDPSGAVMTPMMADPNQENNQHLQFFKHENRTSEQEKVSFEIYHTQSRMCAEADTYGMAICIETEAKRAHYIDEYPLYYFLGYTHFAFKLEPAQSKKPVDKIHIEINGGPNKAVRTLSKMIDVFRNSEVSNVKNNSKSLKSAIVLFQLLDVMLDPAVTLKALAISGSAKPDGYEAAAYFTQAAHKDDIQLLVSQVGEEANWKLCSDANVDKAHKKTKIHLRWGAECQTYKMVMKAAISHLPGSQPTLFTTVRWDNVPVYMKEVAKRVQKYIPGMAFLLGFYQKHTINPANQVSALITAASSEYFNLKMKIPELTLYKQAIQLPFPVLQLEEMYAQSEDFREPFFMFRDLKACSLQRQPVKVVKAVSVLGTQSSCQSVEPILRCREGCYPTSTVEQSVDFDCAPLSILRRCAPPPRSGSANQKTGCPDLKMLDAWEDEEDEEEGTGEVELEEEDEEEQVVSSSENE